MQLKFTIRHPGRAPEDVLVTAPEEARVGHLAAAVHARLGEGPAEGPLTLTISPGAGAPGRALDPDVLLTQSGVWDGAHVGVRQLDGAPAMAPPSPAYRVHRSPVTPAAVECERVELPVIPAEERAADFPWVAAFAPIALGGVLFAVTRSAFSLILIAMSPVTVVGNAILARIRRKRRAAAALERFSHELGMIDIRLEAAAASERAARAQAAPSAAAVAEFVDQRSRELWHRHRERSDFLAITVGTGIALPTVDWRERPAPEHCVDGATDLVAALRAKHSVLRGVPVGISLPAVGVLGLVGVPVIRAEALSAYVAQVAGLHAPSQVAIAVVAGGLAAERLAHLAWLPHTGAAGLGLDHSLAADESSAAFLIDQLSRIIADRVQHASARGAGRGSGSEASFDGPAIVLLIDSPPLALRQRISELLRAGRSHGVYAIWCVEDPRELPAECGAVVDIDPLGTAALDRLDGGGVTRGIRADRLEHGVADAFARAVAPLIDAEGDGAELTPGPIPGLAKLLAGEDAFDAMHVVRRWAPEEVAPAEGASRAPALPAVVGLHTGSDLDLTLDLVRDGPHALVAGTTGSGKSEFLRTWVLAMAASTPPSHLTLLFIDFKGGAAFADLAELPHSVGIVTDLDAGQVRRLLTSLRAELRNRERVIAEHGARDRDDLRRRLPGVVPPRLVVLVDEFAALAAASPGSVDDIVDIAQRGRSLGIHLVLATQRPAGVINDHIRANADLRIALRTAEESDSVDVIGAPDAAALDPRVPGSAIARFGPGRLVEFRTALAGGSTPAASTEIAIEPLGFASLAARDRTAWTLRAAEHGSASASEEHTVDELVAAMRDAARALSVPPPPRPWLDPLPPVVALESLLPMVPPGPRSLAKRARTVPFGVVDDPGEQDQRLASFVPDVDGHLLIVGTSGSGRSTAIRTLVASFAAGAPAERREVYAIDLGSGGLAPIAALPIAGGVIGDDAERIERLMRRLVAELDARADFATCATSPAPARIVLAIDGFSSFRERFEHAMTGGVFSALTRIVAEGRALGIHVVIAADRLGAVPASIAAGIPRRLILRLADPHDLAAAGIRPDAVAQDAPPGRGVFDGLEVQVAMLGGDVDGERASLESFGQYLSSIGIPQAPPIGRLPERVRLADLAARDGDVLRVGISGDSLGVASIDPRGVLLVTGPPGSGRSTALATLVHECAAIGRSLVYFGHARSPLARSAVWHRGAVEPTAAARVALCLVNEPAIEREVVVIESLADVLGGPAESALLALVRMVRREGGLVIAEAESSTLAQSWPLATELKSARRGLVLQPDGHEGEVIFRTPFPRARRSDFAPGRGWLVSGGRVTRVQVAESGPVVSGAVVHSGPLSTGPLHQVA